MAIEVVSDEGEYDWLSISSSERTGNEQRLRIRVNLAHPFMVRFSTPAGEELPMLLRLAAGLAISEATARHVGVRQAGTIRRNLNQLLREALAAPLHVASTPDEKPESEIAQEPGG